MAATMAIVAAGMAVSTSFGQLNALKRARTADALNNVRQVKFALDGFATDFDGQYPNEDTGEQLQSGGTGTKFSNDFFRQLFLSGETRSEKIFWLKNSPIAAGVPDDKILEAGTLRPAEILKPGDVHWAYMSDQTNTSNVARPLLLDCYKRNSTDFDLALHGEQAVVLRIDGSARSMPIDAQGMVRDAEGKDLLSSQSKAWEKSREDPAKLLKQPASGKLRPWTDSTGRNTIQAEFLELKDGNVILRRSDGKSTRPIPLKDLSEADQKLAQELGGHGKSMSPAQVAERLALRESQVNKLRRELAEMQKRIDLLERENAELTAVAENERARAAALKRQVEDLRKKK